MTAMIPFQYGDREVRTVTIDGVPWFVASDVAKILSYRSAPDMTRRLDDVDKGYAKVRTPGGEQELTIISESGLYDAIFRSSAEGAKPFRRWVTGEVLPSIRKTGSYGSVARPELPQDYASALRALATEYEEHEKAKEYARQLEAPAQSWTALADSQGDYSLRDAAQVLSRDHGITIGQNRLMDRIREFRWVSDDDRPYQEYVDRGLLRSRARTYEHPHTGERKTARPQLRITTKGLHEIRVRIAATNELALTV